MTLPPLLPGVGFGDGSHPTTRLCLRALGAFAPARAGWRMLDFGAGNGVLAIAAAHRGALAHAVEIDPAALAHAGANAAHNGVAIGLSLTLADAPGPYDFVMANILRPILLEHAEVLCARLAPGGGLVLSGLVATDLPEVSVRYQALLDRRPEDYRLGDWRALVWRPTHVA
jgi:ribosomal protein L11 methyltransferase